ncbi:MAG: Histidine kinase [Cirrosporium novae-zelandiae]|nr:MAG: Histidine kinase [Cirrosporium novae-zelandiae]
MRIPIREQLALLVVLTVGFALAVLAVSTWITENRFVIHISKQSLALTASLKAAEISSNLLLVQSSVEAITTRILIQSSLRNYNINGTNTAANWDRPTQDLQAALSGGGTNALLLQARIYGKNDSGIGDKHGLLNVTGNGILGAVELPYGNSNGTAVYLGDEDYGYPPGLYPNLTYSSVPVNSTFNTSYAFYKGRRIDTNSPLILGPLQLNESFALLSLTEPVINNTSAVDVLGFLTIVFSANMMLDILKSPEGLDNTGLVLLCGPTELNSIFLPEIEYTTLENATNVYGDRQVEYKMEPLRNVTRGIRHSEQPPGTSNLSFSMNEYPAILRAFAVDNGNTNNADSMFATHNEEKKSVSVGYAQISSSMVDWALIVEMAHSEVVAPIIHLRNLILACVFGTIGVILLVVLPIAHVSVLPIRRLREATRKTVEPYAFISQEGSRMSGQYSDADDGMDVQLARKEGFVTNIVHWRRRRRERKNRRDVENRHHRFRIPGKVQDKRHLIHDELSDLTRTYNDMTEELMMQYQRLEERVKERTHELELSKKAAEAANESKTLFIANISHELKTPLNGILGLAAVSMQEQDLTKIQRSLGIIYKSGDLLLHLLNDILTFSKNEIGSQLSLDEKEFRLVDISSQVISIFEKQAKEAKIELGVAFWGPVEKLESTSGIPEMIYGPTGTGRVRDMCLWGDQHRILQVVINLVSNSLKFTPQGGSVQVRIRCLGEVEKSLLPLSSSRKNSTNSKQSKQSKLSKQSRPSRRSKQHSSNGLKSPDIYSSDPESVNRTPLSNPASPSASVHASPGSKKQASVTLFERSISPPPLNAKTLAFIFEVEDTGLGIPESQQQRIFEPFVQGDLGLSKKYGGTGLGLSICSQLASLMGGKLNVRSQEGVGSIFSMQIPLRYTREKSASTANSSLHSDSRRSSLGTKPISDEPASKTTDPATDMPPDPAQNAPPPKLSFETQANPRLVGFSQPFFANSPALKPSPEQKEGASRTDDRIRVLVAEDNLVNQEVVTRMLKLEDIYDVTLAKDGQEAYDLVKANMAEHKFFDLIFMDVQMPNVDGLQSTRLIRSMGYNAPIVALTAYAEEQNVKECMDSGMNYFLSKPIKRANLRTVLKKYCTPIPEVDEGESSSPKIGHHSRRPSRSSGPTGLTKDDGEQRISSNNPKQ